MEPGEPDGGSRGVSFQLTPRRVVAIVVVILLITFIAVNNGNTEVSFVFFSTTLPLWAVLGCTAALGVGVGMLLGSRRAKARMAAD